MQETLSTLRALQVVDVDIFKVESELKRLPKERAKRQEEIDRRKERQAELEARMHDLKTRIKEIEDHTDTARLRMRKVEQESRQSRGDVALLMAFEHQVKTIKRDIGTSEEEGLSLMESMERVQAEKGALDAEIEGMQAEFDAYSANVDAEIAEATGKLEGLQADRSGRFQSEVPGDVLDTYEQLLAVRGGQALAVLEDRVCQACFMEAPKNLYVRVARGVDLVQCPSCDRILYIA